MPWSTLFDEPITLPRGVQLLTLQDAADYIMKLPRAEQNLQLAMRTFNSPVGLPPRATRALRQPFGASMKIIVAFAVGLSLAGILSTAPAQAQNNRSFVSGHGSDTNACTLAAPCRTFQRAHDMTNASGEIDVLDPAGYGSLTINKAISIVNDGVGTSSVLVPSGGTGIAINAPGASDAVSLRGITVEGAGVGQTGIGFGTGGSLTIVNCVIRHVTGLGVAFIPSATSSLVVSNTTSSDNGGDGFKVQGSQTVTAVFNRVEANNNTHGIGINVNGAVSPSTSTTKVTISDSVMDHNSDGVDFDALTTSSATTVTLFHSVITNNSGVGVNGPGDAGTLRLAQSVVTGNTNGWEGLVQSYGDNYIDGNGANQGAPSAVTRK
jgi:Right handed beta helix region